MDKFEEENGIAHHGAPILTRRDYGHCVAMVKWIETARASGLVGYGPEWLPTGVDIEKSRLFWRLRSGKAPLPHAPPTCYSCPWYEVVEELTPHWTHECWVGGKEMLLHKLHAFIGQCPYEVEKINHSDGSPEIVTFGPWRFKVWAGKHPQNPTVDGFYIQRIVDNAVQQSTQGGADASILTLQKNPEM